MSGAARTAAMDQSTIARRLAAIEADLGAVLFARSSTGLVANEAGRVVIAQALAIERSAHQIQSRLPHRLKIPQGSVRLLSSSWLLARLAANGLETLRNQFPEIELIMIVDTQRRSIARGETDLSMFFDLAPCDGELASYVCDVPYALYGPKGFDAQDVPWMTIWNAKEQIDPMQSAGKNTRKDETFAFKTNDLSALLAAIQAGIGKALIPVCMGEEAPGVVRLSTRETDVVRRLRLHTHPDVADSPHIQSVISWLREVCPMICSYKRGP